MKANNQQKIRKKSHVNMINDYEMMINDNNEDLRWERCHLPQIG